MSESELYEIAPEEFVAARDALAKATGDRDEKKRIKALRRPSVAAWALNQASRREPEVVRSLLDTASGLRDAHVSGGQSLRDLLSKHRSLVGRLTDAAVDVLRAAGREAETQRRRITSTIEAATTDDGVADELVCGRLSADHDPSSFGDVLGDVALPDASPPRRAATPAAPKRAAPRRPAARDRDDDRQAEEQDRARQRERERARKRAEERSGVESELRDLRRQRDKLAAKIEVLEHKLARLSDE